MSDPAVAMNKVQEVSVSAFIPHPLCVAGVFLTSLTSESGSRIQHTSREAESLLLNVSGKLLMFQRDRSGPQIRPTQENHKPRVVGAWSWFLLKIVHFFERSLTLTKNYQFP